MTKKPNRQPFHASVITLFPEVFPATLAASLIGRALKEKRWQLDLIDLKQFADKAPSHHIDGTPAGGGAGMVMRPNIVAKAIEAAKEKNPNPLVYLTPAGKPLTQKKAQALSQAEGLILLCGRFEGIDQRVLDVYDAEEISIGDFVLAGGEAAALVLLEALVRLLPDVVGDSSSLDDESFSNPNLLEYPHYTAPREWRGQSIPSVLLSGNHKAIAAWRKEQAHDRTAQRRADLREPKINGGINSKNKKTE